MIELQIINGQGSKIVSLNSVDEINKFFGTNYSNNHSELLIGLMTDHNRITYEEIEYYYSNVNIDNKLGKTVITYKPTK